MPGPHVSAWRMVLLYVEVLIHGGHYNLLLSLHPVCATGIHTDGMEHGNFTRVTEFMLLGLPQAHKLQLFLFFLFLLFYIIILPGNVLIILTIWSDPHLGSPMYFLLANVAFWTSAIALLPPLPAKDAG